jgi:hypothetical protein
MLRSASELFGTKILATDGDIGTVHDFLFDDDSWTVRYMVADTGGWLSGRLVLISPEALGHPEWEARSFPVNLTRSQVEESPPIESDMPVTREREMALRSFFGWPAYWGGGIISAATLTGYPLIASAPEGSRTEAEAERKDQQTSRMEQDEPREEGHLRSVREVSGYRIAASDGEIGHADDFLIDDADWCVRYMVVDTRNWLPGKDVVVSPGWIHEIDWRQGEVSVSLGKEQIETAPEYKRGMHVARAFEESVFRHYGRDPYWGKTAGTRRL